MSKTLDEYFIDWESSAFGFGYGTGEPIIMPILRQFLDLCREGSTGNAYDYHKLETALGATPTWLLINILCREEIIEYGTSPRCGWLTATGEKLRDFVTSKSADELIDLVCGNSVDYITCSRDACNCGLHGYEKGRVCANPFWGR